MPNTASIRLITLDEVIDRIPYSKVHIYRLIERGEFPRTIPVGAQRIAFSEQEINDWIAARLRKRDESPNDEATMARKKLAKRAAKARYSKTQ